MVVLKKIQNLLLLSAKKLNINAIELNVQYTKDKKVVVIHYKFLNRLSNLNAFVKDS